MARKQRIVGNLPSNESAEGHFSIDEIENDEVVIHEETADIGSVSSGVVVTYEEQTITFRSGNEVLKSGGRKERIFSPETHGKDWRKSADEFIESCKTNDGQRRPKFISEREI